VTGWTEKFILDGHNRAAIISILSGMLDDPHLRLYFNKFWLEMGGHTAG
jgi:hypothetical protein